MPFYLLSISSSKYKNIWRISLGEKHDFNRLREMLMSAKSMILK
jgi:hypothetical protein